MPKRRRCERGDDPDLLAIVWHKKALAAGELQEPERRVEFLEKAVDYARRANAANPGGLGSYARVRTEHADSLAATRSVTVALDSFAECIAENEKVPPNGFLIHAHCQMTAYYLHLGDIERCSYLLGQGRRDLQRTCTSKVSGATPAELEQADRDCPRLSIAAPGTH